MKEENRGTATKIAILDTLINCPEAVKAVPLRYWLFFTTFWRKIYNILAVGCTESCS